MNYFPCIKCEICNYDIDRLDSDSEDETKLKCPVCHNTQEAPTGFYDLESEYNAKNT